MTPLALAGNDVEYDIESYVENTVHPIYMLLREFGLKYEDLLPGSRQVGLDAFMGVNTCRV